MVTAPAMDSRRHHSSAGRATAAFLLSLLALSPFQPASASWFPGGDAAAVQLPVLPSGTPQNVPSSKPKNREMEFTLKHVFHHGTHKYPNLHRRLDVKPDAPLYIASEDGSPKELAPPLRARSQPANIERLVDRSPETINSYLEAKRWSGHPVQLPASAWTVDEVAGPNVTDKESVLTFARVAANAYVLEPHTGDWIDVGSGFNYTEDFGWESDGLRGHIFADTVNSTIVIGIKGTSPAVFDGSETTTNDKVNDNLFFGCCCGQGGQYMWRQVCDCMTSTFTCNSTCLVQSLREKNRYYYAVQDLYHNATALYPDADVWIAGHSLGGATGSLLGLTYGLPTITFEAPGEAMAAARLGLPTPPDYHLGSHQDRPNTGVYHFGHTADPMFMGLCNTATSVCTIAGYAMQSVCHTGSQCVYDTVGDLGWRVGAGTHKIQEVIRDVIEAYDKVPECKPDVGCTDCYNWKFFESNGSDTTTTSRSSTSTTKTRTETCKTPGWFGCLDETTTSGPTTTHYSTITTTTCDTPGWFGCKDTTTHTITSTTTLDAPVNAPAPTITTTSAPLTTTTTSSSSSTTCETPGWFGCNDPTTTTTAAPSSMAPTTTQTASTSCTNKEWFGLICVDPSPTASPKPEPPKSRKKCAHRSWTGKCKEWENKEVVEDEI
ncbi:uncharacterized protein K452DRAFT_316078 [Aplosporella prunicola CBS 121167]|uniref:triacylglycerol lipase n=1 Tax=Aplosporella prunicola CBS 121167 TaxID=1176127 RepID=A0A6A6BNW8_9PEZI|nr:uncharacterized protein K452DRAFT_316078 [Aplosporella prunicola CBS 121167]KAF2144934.1 hypothetical protein K452DRAFT_316078 [Aplosporella prunicola CBS 121167]